MRFNEFSTKGLPPFRADTPYYSEVRFGILPGAIPMAIKHDVDILLKKMEEQIIFFIPVSLRYRVRWYAKLPTSDDKEQFGAVGWDYIPARRK